MYDIREKARIPTKAQPNSVKKLTSLYQHWKGLQKNSKKASENFKKREHDFQNNLDNLFDIAHAGALDIMKIEEDKLFLQQQREPGRPGCLAGVDKTLAEKEKRTHNRKLMEEQRRNKYINTDISCTLPTTSYFESPEKQQDISTSSHESIDEFSPEKSQPSAIKKRGRKEFITAKLVATLDRCQLSIRDSVYILQATLEALNLNCDEFPVNKSSIQRVRAQIRKERAEIIKSDFKNDIPELVTVHWDGKLLPGLDARSSKEERLPIVISFGDKEQILAVPILENSTGKEQSLAISNALQDWNLTEKVEIMCCDTNSFNTGRFNGACALLEQTLEKELLLFACRWFLKVHLSRKLNMPLPYQIPQCSKN